MNEIEQNETTAKNESKEKNIFPFAAKIGAAIALVVTAFNAYQIWSRDMTTNELMTIGENGFAAYRISQLLSAAMLNFIIFVLIAVGVAFFLKVMKNEE